MSRPQFYNLLGAVPLIAWYGWGLSQTIPVFLNNYQLLSAGAAVSAAGMLAVVAQVASIAFVSFLILLLVVREEPVTRMKGIAPRTAALAGTFATASFFVLPPVQTPLPVLIIATLCTVVGLVLSLVTLVYLGRSFAILPDTRTLVTDGPYRFIRHPLYLFEEVVVVGIMLQFTEPWSALVLGAHLAAQFARMHYEEQALTEAFPSYASYAARTARLIPGVY